MSRTIQIILGVLLCGLLLVNSFYDLFMSNFTTLNQKSFDTHGDLALFGIARAAIIVSIHLGFLFTLVVISAKRFKLLFFSSGLFLFVWASSIAVYGLFLHLNMKYLDPKLVHKFVVEFIVKATTTGICGMLSFLLAYSANGADKTVSRGKGSSWQELKNISPTTSQERHVFLA
jgi:hypothetical protein